MAAPTGVDPREVLGVAPDATPAEITAAFRRQAKRWHPDRLGGELAADRMALVNAAYAALRDPPGQSAPTRTSPSRRTPSRNGDDLDPALRRALGAELRAALEPGETVGLVTPSSTWASPQTLLAVTDRRLLWLLDDVPVHRVRWLTIANIRRAWIRPIRPWRRHPLVVCEDRRGRRYGFGDLPVPTADAIVRRIAGGPSHDE